MVVSYMELLDRAHGGKLDEVANKYIHFAADGARRMQELVNSLLRYSRIETSAFLPQQCYEASKLENPWLSLESGQAFNAFLEYVRSGVRPMPALALVDINMPGLSGLDVLRKMRSESFFADLPIFCVLTSSTDRGRVTAKLPTASTIERSFGKRTADDRSHFRGAAFSLSISSITSVTERPRSITLRLGSSADGRGDETSGITLRNSHEMSRCAHGL